MPDDPFALQNTPATEDFAARTERQNRMLRRLDSKKKADREDAIQELQTWPLPSLISLIGVAGHDATPEQSWRQLAPILAVMLSLALALYSSSIKFCAQYPLAAIIICSLPTITALLFSIYRSNNRGITSFALSQRGWESFAAVVQQVQSPDFLPASMRLLYSSSKRMYGSHGYYPYVMKRALFTAASQLILNLDIEQIRIFGIQKQAFYMFIEQENTWADPQVSIRILNILAEIGTSSAIPIVASVANAAVITPQGNSVREAARACLQVLKQRQKEAELPGMLLRAASAPAPPADTLLRPAGSVNHNAAPEFLLRPTADAAGEPAKQGKMVSEEQAALQTTS